MLDKATLSDLPNVPVNLEVADSIPAVCHYDSHTVLTKDGELVQTIEITGESVDLSSYTTVLRDEISKAISETVKDYKVAIYLHTVRSRKNVMPRASFKNEFARKLNADWCAKNNFDKQLVNTVYITLLYQGSSHSIVNLGSLLKSLVYPWIKKEQLKYLEESHKKLEAITAQLLNKLAKQGARRLGLIETKEGVISEQMMFYYHLLHLDQRKVFLATQDISTVLAGETIKFNFNSIDIDLENNGDKRYAAVFSIKDYYEISPEILDQLLQLGFQYVLTQTIIFVPPKIAIHEYAPLAEIAYLSKGEYINRVTGIKRFMTAEDDGDFSYCKQQTTITIFSDEIKFFEDRMKQASKVLHKLGISCIREDFNMAALFWGQLPGNMRFLTHGRFSYLDTKRIGAYCTIFDREVGNYQGSKWGAPISLVRTDKGTAFYFNFHNKNGLGHTLLVGPSGSGKTVISRFLLTQALKVEPTVLYIDLEGNSKNFIETLGGTYLSGEDVKKLKLNPFMLQSFKRKPSLFKDWLIDAIFPKARSIQSYEEVFDAVALKLYENIDLPNKVDVLNSLLANLNDSSLNESAQDFFKNENKFLAYFSEEEQKFDLFKSTSKIVGIDLSELMKDQGVFKAYMGVFLEYVLNSIGNKGPTIIYISKFDALYSITHLKQVLSEWLRVLDTKNGIMVANCVHQDEFEKDSDYQAMIDMMGTKIFLSDKNADKYFRRCYRLTDDELHKVKSYSASRRSFLVKQDDIYKMLLLNLTGMESDMAILDTAHAK